MQDCIALQMAVMQYCLLILPVSETVKKGEKKNDSAAKISMCSLCARTLRAILCWEHICEPAAGKRLSFDSVSVKPGEG